MNTYRLEGQQAPETIILPVIKYCFRVCVLSLIFPPKIYTCSDPFCSLRLVLLAFFLYDPSAEEDLPIITPGDNLSGAGLGNNEYGKPALGYLAMKDLLGDVLFKKCLHEYMARWHGKHPIPWDFFYTFNDASGKDLNWFWSNWFFGNNYIDMGIKTALKTGKGYDITIENIGGMAAR
jgi:hypothetical protein